MHEIPSTFATQTYLRARAIWRGQKPRHLRLSKEGGGKASSEQSVPFGRGRDPRLLGELIDRSARDMGWSVALAQVRLVSEWPRLVGDVVAPHTQVVGLHEEVLTVQCDSTAWATELRRLRGEILNRIVSEFPDLRIRDLRFLAPGAPSWRHGPRTVRGRGPRDTYG